MKKFTLSASGLIAIGAALCNLALINPAFAGDPQAGKAKSATCVACHGADGNSQIPENPRLAGQYQDYLVHALGEYQSGVRKNPIMRAMVATLSQQDIADLAAWFASQKGLNVLPNKPLE